MPTVRPFQADDYPVYAAWFADPDLDRYQPWPIAMDWLDSVLSETDGTTLALLDGPRLVAVGGVYTPTPPNRARAITCQTSRSTRPAAARDWVARR